MSAPSITARTLASSAAIESVAAEWRALEQATPEATGFQSPAWRRSCDSSESPPRLVAIREDGRLVMLLPLQIRRICGATVARWLGEPLAQYGDALALPGPRRPAWFDAAQAEIAGWSDLDLLALSGLRADGVLAACGAPIVFGDPSKSAAPYVDLGLGLRRRRSVERRMKRLAAHGPLRLEAVAGAGARREAAEQALAFKSEWLRRRCRFSASLSDAEVVACVRTLAEKGALRAHRLWAGPRLAAVELGLRRDSVYRSLIGAFDPDLAEGAPGHALTVTLLPQLAGDGVTLFDFLPPADPYKLAFATGATAMGGLYRPFNARGAMAALVLSRLRPLAKDAIHALSDRGLPFDTLLRRFARAEEVLTASDSESLMPARKKFPPRAPTAI
ncbi:GNAT family N-acetyltransferase [Rhodoblastus sp.]|uniref:GNAT family N-acetyltransferase n=1 Tax=Rhodoblastus sp. TaxID=1962975 RepID=UPI003F97DF15